LLGGVIDETKAAHRVQQNDGDGQRPQYGGGVQRCRLRRDPRDHPQEPAGPHLNRRHAAIAAGRLWSISGS